MTARPKGGSSAKSPEDVLRFGTVDQVEICVRSSNQNAASNEEKLGVRFIAAI